MSCDPGTSLNISARKLVRTLRASNHEAYWAGGCVRDIVIERPPKDYDIATSATPEEVLALFPHGNAIGRHFGVIQVELDGQHFEVATFRKDLDYVDGRHPESVSFCSAEEDAQRRDFTINGMFLDPEEDKIIDYVGGQRDCGDRIVRAIGDAGKRFAEDHLRILRAVRFAATLEFTIAPETRTAIREHAHSLTKVSAERVREELNRLLLETAQPSRGVLMLHELGILQVILPEISAMVGQEQPPAFHPEGDVFTHTLMMLDAARERSIPLAYAILFHDVGKPPTAQRTLEKDGSERIRFNRHAAVGAEMAEKIMKRLKFSNQDIEEVSFMVGNHMRFMEVQRMKQSTLRRLVGAKTFPLELELHRVDCLCSHGDLSNYEFLVEYIQQLDNEPALPKPWITGHDLMSLGVPKGPDVGRWLEAAYQAQLEEQFGSREDVLEWLKAEIKQEQK